LAAALLAADSDLVITIGGASVGDHDLVVPVLRDLGADLDFWKIAMRPGKPLLAGTLRGRRIIGLPGNPVSAYVGALLFVLPLLARLGGRAAALRVEHLPLTTPLPANGARRDHLRARRTAAGVEPFAAQDSALLGRLAAARRPAGLPMRRSRTTLPTCNSLPRWMQRLPRLVHWPAAGTRCDSGSGSIRREWKLHPWSSASISTFRATMRTR
jgi:molybdopterin molybdotransferase